MLFTLLRGVPAEAPSTIFGTSLAHWYREAYSATSGTFIDETGNANGSSTGATKPAAGSANGHVTVSCDGGDVIVCGDVTTLDGATGLTVAGAFKASAPGAYGAIVAKLYGGTALFVGANAAGDRLIACVGPDFDLTAATSNANPFDGNWHTFVFSWAVGATGVLYVDGVAQTTQSPTAAATVPNTSEPLSLGGVALTNSGPFDYHWTGEIANVSIATRAPTGGEVSTLHTYLGAWVTPATSAVAGTSAGVATTSGAITGRGAVASNSAGVATTSGAITGRGAVAGTATGVATTSAAIAGRGAVAVSVAGVASTSGAIAARGAVAGLSTGVATTSAAITSTTVVAYVVMRGTVPVISLERRAASAVSISRHTSPAVNIQRSSASI
jgi:hypothetical protein